MSDTAARSSTDHLATAGKAVIGRAGPGRGYGVRYAVGDRGIRR